LIDGDQVELKDWEVSGLRKPSVHFSTLFYFRATFIFEFRLKRNIYILGIIFALFDSSKFSAMTKAITFFFFLFCCIFFIPVFFGVVGGVFGLIGGIIGAIFGLIGSIIGGIFSLIGGIFDFIFDWNFHPFFFHWDVVTIVAVVLVIILLSRSKR
jgi:hypothetical protein